MNGFFKGICLVHFSCICKIKWNYEFSQNVSILQAKVFFIGIVLIYPNVNNQLPWIPFATDKYYLFISYKKLSHNHNLFLENLYKYAVK